mgnify:CR=1 FL=1
MHVCVSGGWQASVWCILSGAVLILRARSVQAKRLPLGALANEVRLEAAKARTRALRQLLSASSHATPTHAAGTAVPQSVESCPKPLPFGSRLCVFLDSVAGGLEQHLVSSVLGQHLDQDQDQDQDHSHFQQSDTRGAADMAALTLSVDDWCAAADAVFCVAPDTTDDAGAGTGAGAGANGRARKDWATPVEVETAYRRPPSDVCWPQWRGPFHCSIGQTKRAHMRQQVLKLVFDAVDVERRFVVARVRLSVCMHGACALLDLSRHSCSHWVMWCCVADACDAFALCSGVVHLDDLCAFVRAEAVRACAAIQVSTSAASLATSAGRSRGDNDDNGDTDAPYPVLIPPSVGSWVCQLLAFGASHKDAQFPTTTLHHAFAHQSHRTAAAHQAGCGGGEDTQDMTATGSPPAVSPTPAPTPAPAPAPAPSPAPSGDDWLVSWQEWVLIAGKMLEEGAHGGGPTPPVGGGQHSGTERLGPSPTHDNSSDAVAATPVTTRAPAPHALSPSRRNLLDMMAHPQQRAARHVVFSDMFERVVTGVMQSGEGVSVEDAASRNGSLALHELAAGVEHLAAGAPLVAAGLGGDTGGDAEDLVHWFAQVLVQTQVRQARVWVAVMWRVLFSRACVCACGDARGQF